MTKSVHTRLLKIYINIAFLKKHKMPKAESLKITVDILVFRKIEFAQNTNQGSLETLGLVFLVGKTPFGGKKKERKKEKGKRKLRTCWRGDLISASFNVRLECLGT